MKTTKTTKTQLARFVDLTSAACYNYELKKEYRKLGGKILKDIVAAMGLQKSEYDVRWNPGGIACSGDHTLHTDKVYLALHDNINFGWFYFRTCKGRKDYSGGTNQIVHWSELKRDGLDCLVGKLKKIQNAS